MRKANNNSNFTVENLVAKYRKYVLDHASCKLIYADEESDFWGSVEYKLDGLPDHQLLITLYNDVAGEKADPIIQNMLSKYAEHYWKGVLNAEEYTFLCKHFTETVNYIFSNGFPNGSESSFNSLRFLMKNQNSFVSMAYEYVDAKLGNTIYIEEDILGDGAVLFPQCIILLCQNNDKNDYTALKRIRLYAAGIRYKNIDKIEGESIDIIISGPALQRKLTFETSYKSLADNGTMVLWAHSGLLVSKSQTVADFRKQIVSDKSLKSILKYESDEGFLRFALVLEKKEQFEFTINDYCSKTCASISYDGICHDILLPGYYLAEKPENGIPLSDIVKSDIPENNEDVEIGDNGEIPEIKESLSIINPHDLGVSFKDADINRKNLKKVSDYYGELNKLTNGTIKSLPSSLYCISKPCVLLFGNSNETYAGYMDTSIDETYAVVNSILYMIPKEGVDLRYVVSLLFNPIVSKQISALYLEFSNGGIPLSWLIDYIIVPFHDKHEQTIFFANTCYDALCSSQLEIKQENEFYRKSVRIRKHALTQSLSSVEAMFYRLNSYREKHGVLNNEDVISRVKKTTVHEAFEFISQGLKDMMPALEHIAEVEYTFKKPEWIDPEKFIEDYIQKNEKGWLNFKPVVTWEQGHNQTDNDLKDPVSGETVIRKGESFNLFLFPKDALERVFKNIISNAKAHGFGDKSRNDYQVRFSWHTDGMSLAIEIENNGSPIPSNRDTASLLEYGVSTKLHHDGHNGIGCNEIDDIMKRYDGKIEIVSLPEKEFPVKYTLTFNRSNNVRSFKL